MVNDEAERASALLENRSVKRVLRPRTSEVVLEFSDETRLLVNAPDCVLELSITGGDGVDVASNSSANEDEFYRAFIDRLVAKCTAGFFERRVQSRVWNQNAGPSSMPEDHARNQLLESLHSDQLEVLGRLLAEMTSEGVFNVLVALYEEGVRPFDRGYEGDPFHDFVGRMDGWEWPIGEERV